MPGSNQICGYPDVTLFTVDNGCSATSPTSSYRGCWQPVHRRDAELVSNAINNIMNQFMRGHYATNVSTPTR